MPMFFMADPQTTGMRAPETTPFPETGLQILGAQFAALEIFVHQLIVGLGDVFDQDVPVFLDLFGHIGGNIDCFCRSFLAVEHEGLHGDQIHHPGKCAFCADGKRGERDLLAQTCPDAFHGLVEIGPFPIHPADEEKAGKIEFIGVFPDLFRLKFDAADGIDEDHRPVHDPEAAFRVKGKIGITRRVDDVDPVLVPIDMVCGGADRDMSSSVPPVHSPWRRFPHQPGRAGPFCRRHRERIRKEWFCPFLHDR